MVREDAGIPVVGAKSEDEFSDGRWLADFQIQASSGQTPLHVVDV